ncbi:uncharacterized protein LOC113313564 isoform X2 [Papaver somniferum]|uniref:uncharacterized protein LOC113313564 isoform X2 n=1 Tax=Papaver somniferum TaxID=3469 RepID=UPI000E6FBB34|nr:uncharacterized protein LOC113313564 isoform X2 [Papaver somniferum]
MCDADISQRGLNLCSQTGSRFLLVNVQFKTELPQSQKVVWRIENFSKLKNQQQLYSDTFSFNGRKWGMVINPKDNPRSQTHLTVYLRPVDRTKSVFADYTLSIIDQKDDSRTVKREVVGHEIKGFCCGSFVHLSELHSPANGYLLNDTCIVELKISKQKSIVEDYLYYLDNLSPVDSMFFLALSCFLVSYLTCVSLVSIGSYKLPFYIDMILVASLTGTLVSGTLKFLLPKDYVTRDSSKGVGEKKISVPLPAKGIELVSNTDQVKVSKAALKKNMKQKAKIIKLSKRKPKGRSKSRFQRQSLRVTE